MSVPTVADVRRPPHDPLTLLLGGRLGWPLLKTDVSVHDGSLTLPRLPASLRPITEPSGSFGGLRLPANVALDADGGIWLVPPTEPLLRHFDPCACGFVDVPCFGGVGAAPGQLQNQGGIAIAGGHLFVCDPGNQRV